MTVEEACLLKRGDKIMRTKNEVLTYIIIYDSENKYTNNSETGEIFKGQILTFKNLDTVFIYKTMNDASLENEIDYDYSGIITFEYPAITFPFKYFDVLNEYNLKKFNKNFY